MSDTTHNDPGAPRRTHRVYSLQFKQQIVNETLQPGACVAAIARKHNINDNIVFEWRRLHRLGKLELSAPMAAPSMQHPVLLPVGVIDSPCALSAMPHQSGARTPEATPGCEVEIEVGKCRVRIRGLPTERAEQFLRECLQ